MIWALATLAALAGAPDPALVRQEGLVAEAAAAVAQARHDGQRSARVAELMAVYRQEAERLAAIQAAPDLALAARAHEAALRALGEATARGAEDVPSRTVVEAWLGPLAARLSVLDLALGAAMSSTPDFARPIAADVESQAVAVMLIASYDASRADAVAREAQTRAAALRATHNPLERTGLAVEVELRELLATSDQALALAAENRLMADRARDLRDRARLVWEK